MANPQKELSEKSQLLKKLIRSSGREGCNALPAPYAGPAITAAAGPGHTLSGRPCRPAPTLRLSMRTWWRVPGPDVGAVKECLEGFQNRGVGGLRQQAEQPAVAFDQNAENAGDGKGPVTMRDGSQDL